MTLHHRNAVRVWFAMLVCSACGSKGSAERREDAGPARSDVEVGEEDAEVGEDQVEDVGANADDTGVQAEEAGSDAESRDAADGAPSVPAGPRVEVDAIGRLVVFHSADGEVITRKQDRLSYPLPAGALVTIAEQALVTVMDVTAPATLFVPDELPPVFPRMRSIEFEIPAHGPELTYSYDTGCSHGSALAGLNRVEIQGRCVDERGAELVVSAHDPQHKLLRYADLKDIPVAGAADEPVRVVLSAWHPAPTGQVLTVTGLPPGTSSLAVEAVALRGHNLLTFGGGVTVIGNVEPVYRVDMNNALPEIGGRWVRRYALEEQGDLAGTYSERKQDGGVPLQLGLELPAGALLPIPSLDVDLGAEPRLSWAPSGVEQGATRVGIELTWDAKGSFRRWTLWLKPGPTSLRLPKLPAWMYPAGLEHVASVSVSLQRREADGSWSDVLKRLHIPHWLSVSDQPLGLTSKRTWKRTTP